MERVTSAAFASGVMYKLYLNANVCSCVVPPAGRVFSQTDSNPSEEEAVAKGISVGTLDTDGVLEGASDGLDEGAADGFIDGMLLSVGVIEGRLVGLSVGDIEGRLVGRKLGACDGNIEGC
jgi:hypothetical protein